MRITNSILQRNALANIQGNLRKIHEASEQVASGKRFRTASDDPVAAGAVMRGDGQLRALAQYRRNIGAARARLSVEESVLDELGDLLTRAKELGVGQLGPGANATTRQVAKAELDRLVETAVQLGNTHFEGGYLFAGNGTGAAPFDPSGAPTGDLASTYAVEIASGQAARANHDGQEVFLDTGVFDALRDLAAALGADDATGIGNALSALDGAFDGVQRLVGETGARTVRLDIAEANVESLDTNLRVLRSDLADVEMEEALATLVNRQTAYQAALLANSRILQTTLTDYLR